MPINPGGTATYGFEIRREGRRIYEDCGVVGKGKEMSNNVAEYRAVQKAAEWLLSKELDSYNIVFRSDSKLVVNQMNGEWEVKKGLYVEYYLKARERIGKLKHIRFEWIPREENEYADSLTEKAYREYTKSSR